MRRSFMAIGAARAARDIARTRAARSARVARMSGS